MNSNKSAEVVKRLRLRRPNHSNELITALHQSLSEECFTDATLVCEEKTIKVHRIILSLFSQYFKRTFALMSAQSQCHYPVIAIKNIPFLDLKAIVEFVYGGEVSIPKHQLNSLLKSAQNLEIEGLRSDNCKDLSLINKTPNNSNHFPFNNTVNDYNLVNNPIIASSLAIPAQPLRWDLIPSPKRKRIRNTANNRGLKTNSCFIPTNSSQVMNSNFGNASALSIVSLVPVSHNNMKTYNRIEKDHKQNRVVLVKTPIESSQTPQNKGLISVANNNSCVPIDLQQKCENESQKCKPINGSNTSTISDRLDTNKSVCEGLDRLYELSDEENRTDRKLFIDKLIAFHASNGTPIAFCPTINKQPLDLYRLYSDVKEKGGYEKVTKDKLWIECTDSCKVSRSVSAAYALRLHYKKHLLPFECKYDRNEIDPNLVLKSLESAQQDCQRADSLNNSNTQVLNQTEREMRNNSKQIEEIWIEDDEENESATSPSKSASESSHSTESIAMSTNSEKDQIVKPLIDCNNRFLNNNIAL